MLPVEERALVAILGGMEAKPGVPGGIIGPLVGGCRQLFQFAELHLLQALPDLLPFFFSKCPLMRLLFSAPALLIVERVAC